MLTAQQVKQAAMELGADMVGIGNIERWEGAPIQQDPRQIMPRARSVISMAFRVMRGSLRGIEEGTFFSNYSAMGYGGITYLYMPITVINLAKMIEDDGYEAIPYGHQSDWRAINDVGERHKNFSRPARPGRAAPDVMVHQRIAAYLCGLGEIGYSKMLLTPKFGPRQRVGIVLTELELEPDPIYNGPKLCNRCMACVRDCPGGALPADKTVKVKLAGKEVEWADIDCAKCDIAFRGALGVDRELTPEETYQDPMRGKKLTRGWWTPFFKKPRSLYNTGQAVCGARGCTRACMVSLEARGVIQNKFKHPFRTDKPWKVDWSKPEGHEGVEKESDTD
jgi:ferredoxin